MFEGAKQIGQTTKIPLNEQDQTRLLNTYIFEGFIIRLLYNEIQFHCIKDQRQERIVKLTESDLLEQFARVNQSQKEVRLLRSYVKQNHLLVLLRAGRSHFVGHINVSKLTLDLKNVFQDISEVQGDAFKLILQTKEMTFTIGSQGKSLSVLSEDAQSHLFYLFQVKIASKLATLSTLKFDPIKRSGKVNGQQPMMAQFLTEDGSKFMMIIGTNIQMWTAKPNRKGEMDLNYIPEESLSKLVSSLLQKKQSATKLTLRSITSFRKYFFCLFEGASSSTRHYLFLLNYEIHLNRMQVVNFSQFQGPQVSYNVKTRLWGIVHSEEEYLLGVILGKRWLFVKKGKEGSIRYTEAVGREVDLIGAVGSDSFVIVQDRSYKVYCISKPCQPQKSQRPSYMYSPHSSKSQESKMAPKSSSTNIFATISRQTLATVKDKFKTSSPELKKEPSFEHNKGSPPESKDKSTPQEKSTEQSKAVTTVLPKATEAERKATIQTIIEAQQGESQQEEVPQQSHKNEVKEPAGQSKLQPNPAFSFGVKEIIKHNPSFERQPKPSQPQYPSFNPSQIQAANAKNKPIVSPSFNGNDIISANKQAAPVSPSFGPDEVNKFNKPTNPLHIIQENEKKKEGNGQNILDLLQSKINPSVEEGVEAPANLNRIMTFGKIEEIREEVQAPVKPTVSKVSSPSALPSDRSSVLLDTMHQQLARIKHAKSEIAATLSSATKHQKEFDINFCLHKYADQELEPALQVACDYVLNREETAERVDHNDSEQEQVIEWIDDYLFEVRKKASYFEVNKRKLRSNNITQKDRKIAEIMQQKLIDKQIELKVKTFKLKQEAQKTLKELAALKQVRYQRQRHRLRARKGAMWHRHEEDEAERSFGPEKYELKHKHKTYIWIDEAEVEKPIISLQSVDDVM